MLSCGLTKVAVLFSAWLEKSFNRLWYPQGNHALTLQKFWWLLTLPFVEIFKRLAQDAKHQALKKDSFQQASQVICVPIIVIGNIHVGGMGKSPCVDGLVQAYQSIGLKVGVLLRGYGAQVQDQPIQIQSDTPVQIAGDEAIMHFFLGANEVIVDQNRARGALALSKLGVDIILCDDGLQHYALPRDFEIALVNLDRGFGNQGLLPFGPLREPIHRLKHVDLILSHSESPCEARHFNLQNSHCISTPWQTYSGEYDLPLHLQTKTSKSFTAIDQSLTASCTWHAIAGIANPQAFFDQLSQKGVVFQSHVFPDHHQYSQAELQLFNQLYMTMKDAVKCFSFAQPDWYAIPYRAKVPKAIAENIYEVAKARCAERMNLKENNHVI